jgi:predicted nucleic acid-binding protein
MAKIVLDANVLVGHLDQNDSLHDRAERLLERIRANGDVPQAIDLVLNEAISVVCRRARERKQQAPRLPPILQKVRGWFERGQVGFTQTKLEGLFAEVLELIEQTSGALNYNDAAPVVPQQRGYIGDVATFDATLASHPGFRTVA